jgi:hypothetical protein
MVIASVLDHGDVAQAMPQGVGLGNRDHRKVGIGRKQGCLAYELNKKWIFFPLV